MKISFTMASIAVLAGVLLFSRMNPTIHAEAVVPPKVTEADRPKS